MTIIKKRKGKILLSAAMGAFLMGILCGGIFFVYTQKTGIWPTEFLHMERKLEQSVMIRLSRDSAEGEKLSKENLEEVIVQAPEGYIKRQNLSEYEGKSLKISLDKGSILSEDLVFDGQKTADDERLVNLSYVKLSEKMKAGDYVDIRISFRNGGDYILLSKKKIRDISGNDINTDGTEEWNALWLQVNEAEILRLASAVVDSFYQEGCEIYAIQYVSETQEAATVTYPVNETVKKLLASDPNVVTVAQGKLSDSISDNLSKELQKELRDSLEEEFDDEDREERMSSLADNVPDPE